VRLHAALLAGALAAGWALWLVAAPVAADSRPSGPLRWAVAATYRAGAVICHQRDSRSFHVSGVRMAVCSRCFGLYAGAAAGAAVALAWIVAARRRGEGAIRLPLTPLRAAVLACAVPTLATWLAEHLAGFEVTLLARALAALPLGAAVAALVAAWAAGASFDDGSASAID